MKHTMKTRNVMRSMALAAASLLLFAGVSTAARSAATNWIVVVGAQTPDISVYANGFFPRELTIHTGDTVLFQFAGFHNVTFLSGAAPPPFAIKDGDGYEGNPQVFFPAGSSTYDGTGFHSSGVTTQRQAVLLFANVHQARTLRIRLHAPSGHDRNH